MKAHDISDCCQARQQPNKHTIRARLVADVGVTSIWLIGASPAIVVAGITLSKLGDFESPHMCCGSKIMMSLSSSNYVRQNRLGLDQHPLNLSWGLPCTTSLPTFTQGLGYVCKFTRP